MGEAKRTPPAFSRHRAVAWALILGMSLLMLSGAASRVQAAPSVPNFVPRQVVVEPGSTVSLRKINEEYGTTRVATLSLSNANIYLLQLRAGSSVTETVSRMGKDTRLSFAEPNFVIRPLQGEARHRAWGISDTEPSLQDDATSALNLSMAHNFSQGLGATVAVLDTGVQRDHPALQPNLEGVKGYDFVSVDDDPSDSPDGSDCDLNGEKDEMWGHGTHVAGIVDRVAPAAKIMPLRVLNADGCGDAFAIAEAIIHAKRYGAEVINLSLGTSSKSNLLRKAIQDAIKKDRTKNGAVVVAAAGNSDSFERYYPAARYGGAASADGLVAVTSVDNLGRKSSFANYGGWVDIAAPGEAIYSTFPISLYAKWSGTSMATPFVSGEAALIHAYTPYGSLRPAALEERIRCSAGSLDETNPTFVGMLGAGRADVGASLTPEGACPETTITAGPSGLTNSATTSFEFSSSEVGSTFECSLDNAAFTSCTSPKSYAALADGQHAFSVKATDAAGNTDATPASHTWTIDTAAPVVTIDSKPAALTNNASPSFTFSSDDAASAFECSLSEMAWPEDFEPCSSDKSYGPLTDGTYTFQVRATDAAGNTGAAPSYSFELDATKPAAPSKPDLMAASDTGPSSTDDVTSDDTPTFAGTAEASSTVELFADGNSLGTADSDQGGNWSITVPDAEALAGGPHQIVAKTTDKAGNTSPSSDALSVTVDTTAPNAPVIESPADDSHNDTGDVTVWGTAEPSTTVELFDGTTSKGTMQADAQGNWSKHITGVAEGSHTYTAKAADAAGNISAASNAHTVIVDTTGPAVDTVAPADGATGVALTDNIEATFSEAMDPATLNQETFTLVEQGSATPIEATVTYDGATKEVTLDPSADLDPATTYTATVNTGAKDVAGNPLVAYIAWSFTTAASTS